MAFFDPLASSCLPAGCGLGWGEPGSEEVLSQVAVAPKKNGVPQNGQRPIGKWRHGDQNLRSQPLRSLHFEPHPSGKFRSSSEASPLMEKKLTGTQVESLSLKCIEDFESGSQMVAIWPLRGHPAES